MNAHELLIAARELIASPEAWTQGCLARDAEGHEVMPYRNDAVCWCLMGALRRAAGGEYMDAGGYLSGDDAEEAVEKLHGGRPCAELNDDEHTTHADVLAMLDRAIAETA